MALTTVQADPPVVLDTTAFLARDPGRNFPAVELVPVAAAAVWDAAYVGRMVARRAAAGAACEGPACFVIVSPGSVRFTRSDPARANRTVERALTRRGKRVEQWLGWDAQVKLARAAETVSAALGLSDGGEPVPEPGCDPLKPGKGRSRIMEWSRKSRANMTRRLVTLDYAPLFDAGTPAMCTLTTPDRWEQYTPTGADFKDAVRRFGKRFARAWSRPLVGIWKLEFQSRICDEMGCRCSRRGAPHLHMLICPPRGLSRCGRTWRDWYAATWADCLGLDGEDRARSIFVHSRPEACADYAEGLRMTDPKRVGIYFNKHGLMGAKEYQHNVPLLWQEPGNGPGRFWGVWGLAVIEHSAEVTYDQAVTLARTLRRMERARGAVRKVKVYRTNTRTGEVRVRTVRRPVRRLFGTFGFVAVNDGPGVAMILAESLRT